MGSKMPEFRMQGKTINATLSVKRFERQYQVAQSMLDARVMADMVPLMPHKTGDFIARTKAESEAMQGSGRVMAAAPPFGYFLYWGKVMVDEDTGSAWARPGAHKVVSGDNLEFSGGARAKWFLSAKQKNLNQWLKLAKRTAGGGKK